MATDWSRCQSEASEDEKTAVMRSSSASHGTLCISKCVVCGRQGATGLSKLARPHPFVGAQGVLQESALMYCKAAGVFGVTPVGPLAVPGWCSNPVGICRGSRTLAAGLMLLRGRLAWGLPW